MPYKDSNIPSSIFYSAIGAEMLRIARVCTSRNKFTYSILPLITRMKKQGAKILRIKSTIKRFFNKHQAEFSCIATNYDELCSILNLNWLNRFLNNFHLCLYVFCIQCVLLGKGFDYLTVAEGKVGYRVFRFVVAEDKPRYSHSGRRWEVELVVIATITLFDDIYI